ncbi:MAG: YfcC family protein [Bacilli bacterium]|nr:YfcC family protein [Bacilli bacterium]MDD4809259.1 YfcC family protein [Bacilli bacterium]
MEKAKKIEKTIEPVNMGKKGLTAFSIILILLLIVSIVTWFIPEVTSAKISDIVMAPVNGFVDAVDVCIFVLILGGFLGIVKHTGALEAGIATLVRKLKGNELLIIPVLMFIFSIGGTTYGMLEETVGFYILLAATMVAIGYDTIVGSAIVLLGAGSGVLGSTINPFAVGAAISALPEGISADQSVILPLGVILWLTSYLISVLFVMSYAKKVKKNKGSTFLSLQERKDMENEFIKKEHANELKLTKRQKIVLVLFGLTFVVMILGFIPWVDFGVISPEVADAGTHWSAILTGNCFGYFYFLDAATWFLLMAIIIGLVADLGEEGIVSVFMKGVGEIVEVVMIIAVARGISVIMTTTGLGVYIIENAVEALQGTSGYVFAPLNYLLHIGLSVLVPSSSGLANLSTPIVAPVADGIGLNPSVTIMIYVAANGLVNLITPTCGSIMGGLALAKVEYRTWFKWAFKVVLTIGIASMIILTAAMVML